MEPLSLSKVFGKHLKDLRIADFPCGNGSWRYVSQTRKSRYDSGGAKFEGIEELLDLESSAPYKVDCTWSKEGAALRKIVIENPECLNDRNFVWKHFKTLRIVNENVDHIDESILKFVNLKELTLTANCIKEINCGHLPKELEILELAANKVSDLTSLRSAKLSSLLHLGLAQNQIVEIPSRSFTPSKWVSLLSLDLSYNNLTDLKNTVELLKNLTSLRSLLLVGNPLHLSKCYHGFIIDCIPRLSYLDNHEISADDKHSFRSFSTFKDLDLNCSDVIICINCVNDVKKQIQTEDPDASAYPKIEFKYRVEFKFLKDTKVDETVSQNDELASSSTEELPWAEILTFDFRKTLKIFQLDRLRSFLKDGITFSVIAVKHSYVLEDPKHIEERNTDSTEGSVVGAFEAQKVKTSASKDPVKVEVDNRKNSAKVPKNASKAVVGKEKLGKKDKRDFSDLFELPLECTTLGTCHVSLASFIDGETLVSISTPCIEEKKETENNSVESAPLTAVVGKTNGRKKEKGDDKHQKTSVAGKGKAGKNDFRKSPNTASRKGHRTGKGKEKTEVLNDKLGDEEPSSCFQPTVIKLEVKLDRFVSTNDVIEKHKS